MPKFVMPTRAEMRFFDYVEDYYSAQFEGFQGRVRKNFSATFPDHSEEQCSRAVEQATNEYFAHCQAKHRVADALIAAGKSLDEVEQATGLKGESLNLRVRITAIEQRNKLLQSICDLNGTQIQTVQKIVTEMLNAKDATANQ